MHSTGVPYRTVHGSAAPGGFDGSGGNGSSKLSAISSYTVQRKHAFASHVSRLSRYAPYTPYHLRYGFRKACQSCWKLPTKRCSSKSTFLCNMEIGQVSERNVAPEHAMKVLPGNSAWK